MNQPFDAWRQDNPRQSQGIGRWTLAVTILVFVLAITDSASGNDSIATIDFDTQVIPVLTRYGCNSGACHGAAIGRGGFKLSLFGSRSVDDHQEIVRALEGRRVNLHGTADSLLLRKATETMEHGGGERFSEDSAAYSTLSRWIDSGAKRQQGRRLIQLSVMPTSLLLDDVDQSVPVSVIARFDDQSEEDVTGLTVLSSDDLESVAIDRESNRLLVHRRGEHLVLARYLDRVQPIRLGVPFESTGGDQQFSGSPSQQDIGMIDRLVDAKLSQLRIPASPRSSDFEFARRLWLDLAGQLPSPEDLDRFVKDRADDKRVKLIDRLLETDEFAAYWALKWANILAIDSKRLQPPGNQAYHEWLVQQFRQDAPWDKAAFDMLTATGDGFVDGHVNFIRSGEGPDGLAESATRIFMGVRLRCANCHDHPLDHWTQDDYHGLAAVFAKLKRGQIVSPSDRGEVTHPVTGQPAIPRIPGTRNLSADDDGRTDFAIWVTDPSNPYFARAAVNRIWSQLMGRGLIDPVDDIRATNPASHPELLDSLADEFIESDFRFRQIIRLICNSDAYGRASATVSGNEHDSVYYSHFLPRGLEAEVIANAIADVTGIEIHYGDQNASDAILLTDNRMASETLDVLGRCDRAEACETPGQNAGSLAQVLHFLNGGLLNDRIEAADGRLNTLLQSGRDDADVIRLIYKASLSRLPTDRERVFWDSEIAKNKDPKGDWRDSQSRQEFFTDVFWGLLTSETFLTNH